MESSTSMWRIHAKAWARTVQHNAVLVIDVVLNRYSVVFILLPHRYHNSPRCSSDSGVRDVVHYCLPYWAAIIKEAGYLPGGPIVVRTKKK